MYAKKEISLSKPRKYKTIADTRSSKIADQPLISVSVVTYNHADYIKDALNSILAQSFDGKVEIVVADDCSTDETLEIVNRYAKDAPDIFRVISSETNRGAMLNGRRAYNACRGKYVAILDGDDYWTDVEKLEKQYRFLESNADYVMCYGSVQARHAGCIDYNYIGGVKRDLSQAQLIFTAPINTSTVMFRRMYTEFPMIENGMTIDLVMWSLLGHGGKGRFMKELLPSVYRIHEGGIHSTKSLYDRIIARMFSNYFLFCFYSSKNSSEIADVFWQKIEAEIEYLSKNISSEETRKSYLAIPLALERFREDICRQHSAKLSDLYRRSA